MGIGITKGTGQAVPISANEVNNIIGGGLTGQAGSGAASGNAHPDADTLCFGNNKRPSSATGHEGRNPAPARFEIARPERNSQPGAWQGARFSSAPPSATNAPGGPQVVPATDIESGCCQPRTCCNVAPWKPALGAVIGGLLGTGAYVLWRQYHHAVLGTEPVAVYPYP